MEKNIKVEVDTSELDVAIEKANQLRDTLREVESIVNSLFGRTLET